MIHGRGPTGRVVAGDVGVRAPPELSPPHAEPTSGDSAYPPPLSARGRGRMHAPASAPASRQAHAACATPHRTRPAPRARRPRRQISPPRRGVAWRLLSPCASSLFPRFTSPRRLAPAPITNVATPATNHRPRPPSPHASHLHVSTRAATDHPPTDCDRPNHVSLQIDNTRPLTLLAPLTVPARWGYTWMRSTCQWMIVPVGSGGEWWG
nr:unnamed protein product [Digitaria exilis]